MTAALQLVDAAAIARDAARLVRVPSITGDERAAAAEVVAIAREHGLDAELVEFDLGAMRAAAGYPGEEAPRTDLVGAIVTLPRRGPGGAAPVPQRPCRRRAARAPSPGSATRGRARSPTAPCTAAARPT